MTTWIMFALALVIIFAGMMDLAYLAGVRHKDQSSVEAAAMRIRRHANASMCSYLSVPEYAQEHSKSQMGRYWLGMLEAAEVAEKTGEK